VTRIPASGTPAGPGADAVWSAALPEGAYESRVPARDPEGELARFACLLMDAEAARSAARRPARRAHPPREGRSRGREHAPGRSRGERSRDADPAKDAEFLAADDRRSRALVRRARARSREDGRAGMGLLPLPRDHALPRARRHRSSGGRRAARDADRPRRAAAPPRRVRAHRPAHDAARGPLRGRVLHLLPRARQGLVLQGPAREGRRLQEEPARHPPRGLPARREDLRGAHAREGRRHDRRPRDRRPRQSPCARERDTASATTA
jgi:hypothetical protein